MKTFHKDKSNMKWITADMTKLKDFFDPNSFDIVIDKAAMDALMCDEGDVWSPKAHVMAQATQMCTGISTVLNPGGYFLQISFSQPHFRRKYLLHEPLNNTDADQSDFYGWTLKHHEISIGLGYFFYALHIDKNIVP